LLIKIGVEMTVGIR